jgi:hypothetical protein
VAVISISFALASSSAGENPKAPHRSRLANYFRSSAPRYGLVDPASRLAFRIERPSGSRNGSKKTEAADETCRIVDWSLDRDHAPRSQRRCGMVEGPEGRGGPRRGQGAGRVTWIVGAMLPPRRLAVARVVVNDLLTIAA